MKTNHLPSKIVLAALLAAAVAAGTANSAEPASGATRPAGYAIHSFDLSDLPAYAPQQQIVGTLRITGTPLDSLVGELAGEFKNHHKRVRVTSELINTSQAIAGLVQDSADIGIMGHAAWLSGRQAFAQTYGYAPLEIHFANGSYDDPKGSTPGLVFFVHKDNPLKSLSLEQIDGIFGSARTGAWNGTAWSTAAARGAEGDLRQWNQLGVGGGLGKAAIVPYGTDLTLSNWADLIEKVAFKGSAKWNPALNEGPRADVVNGNRDKWIVKSVQADPAGIGFMFQRVINELGADVRVLPIVASAGGKPVAPGAESFRDQTYPFHNATYLYLNRVPGQPLNPRQREFARFVLSREGQQIIANDRRFIPLSAAELQVQRSKLD